MLRMLVLASAMVFGASVAGATTYTAELRGLNENPLNDSGASGFATLVTSGTDLLVNITFSGLSGDAQAGHLHCCAGPGVNAGVAVPFVVPAVATGSIVETIDLTLASSFTSAFITASGGTVDLARARLLAALDGDGDGGAYVNIHTFAFPGGEIRGNLVAVGGAVPEPASWALLVIGFGVVGVTARQRVGVGRVGRLI